MRARIVIACIAAAMLSACEQQPSTQTVDQCMRREVFNQCLANVPKGPTATVANDWAEVVSQCESAAYWQSKRQVQHVTPECRP